VKCILYNLNKIIKNEKLSVLSILFILIVITIIMYLRHQIIFNTFRIKYEASMAQEYKLDKSRHYFF